MDNPITKPILQSGTTRDVAKGTAAGIAGVAGVIVFLRSYMPGLLPWTADMDVAVGSVLGVVVIPLLSRLAAKLRGK